MAGLNETITFLSPYFSTVEQVIGTISLFVGGIFGIYLITLVVRIVFFKKLHDDLKGMKTSIERIEKKVDGLKKK
ncbi:hypothetical protein ISS07_03375 [Candidatus Woesearchaeota archaeon]|nr:hypothetical protein [Candidatus Woesearchaeota archaeon]